MDRRQVSAVVVGATGLVGSQIVQQALEDARFGEVVTLGRRRTGIEHPKLTEYVIDFERPEDWAELVRGDVLLSALGTTRKAAGGVERQRRVDYDYQLHAAEAAARSGVSTYVLVSSAGANARSSVPYSRMKGELDRDVQTLGFQRVAIIRPGLLAGERSEKRLGEDLANALVRHLPRWGVFDSVRPYPAPVVARACLNAATDETPGSHVYTLAEVLRLGGA